MKIKSAMQRLYRKYASFFNRLPMINSIKVTGKNNDFQLDKPMIKSKIICNGSNNQIVLLPGGGLNRCTFLISGNNNTVFIGNNSSAICATICIEESNNSITIQNDCSLCGETMLAACEGVDIIINDGALFSSNIELRTTDSHPIFSMDGERINEAKSIHIGERVWVGTGVRINKGVSLGNDCVVGNGAVVTKSPGESNVIIAGNPAKVVKRGITWAKERVVLKNNLKG